MKNTRRNKIMSAAIWLIVLASGTGLFVSAQTPTPTPSTKEEKLNAAKNNFDEGFTLFNKGTAESYRAAYEKFRLSSQFYQEIGDTSENAGLSILGMGLISDNLGEKSKALKLYDQALKFFRENKYKDWEATTLNNIGVVYSALGEKQKALEFYNLALPLKKQVGDKAGEALTLSNIGRIYVDTDEKQKSLEYFEASFYLYKELNDNPNQAKVLIDFIRIYYDILNKTQAVKVNQNDKEIGYPYLDINKIFNNATKEELTKKREDFKNELNIKSNMLNFQRKGELFWWIGIISISLGENENAFQSLNLALKNFRDIQNKKWEAIVLNDLSLIHLVKGENQTALNLLNKSLALRLQTGDKFGESITLGNIGNLYHHLGDNITATRYYLESLIIARRVDHKYSEANLFNRFGIIFSDLNNYQEALNFYNQSLLLYREIGDQKGEAASLGNIGLIYSSSNENQKALFFLNQSLVLNRKVGDKHGEATLLTNIGGVYNDLGEKQKALEYFQASLPLSKAVENKSQQSNTLSWLMLYWKSAKNPRFAIFYGKQSVDLLQELRANIQGLDKEIQKTYLKSIEHIYRYLASILITEGRIAEAEQVLGTLKEEEFFEYLRRDDKAAKELKATIKLTPTEEEAFKRYEEIADEITRIGREFGELEKESKKYPVGKFPRQAEMDKFDAQLADARKVFNKFLEELDARFRNKETREKDARVAQISGTKALLDGLNQPRTVIISTIAGEDRLNLIVTTSKINRAHTVDIKAAHLNKLVVEFREAVKNPQVDPRPLGKKLYDVLFPADLQKDLAGVEADTIVWSLDGTLRYAPVSALWDGEKYLVERYSNAIITLASRDKIDKNLTPRTNWTALGLGVSQQFENFDALKAVPQELCRVVNDERKKAACLKLTNGKTGVFGGVNLSDGEFTFESFRLHLGRYPIVHIASHFSLNAGTESDSYLLLGGGKTSQERKLSISAVREQLDTKFVGTELLVLSACNTAMSSGENSSGAEIEGFGALAQEQGAKTVLASLWSVADDSTRDLMTEFYEQLKQNPNTGKAEALRKSQIALLNGKYKPGETPLWRGTAVFNLGETKQPAFKTDANAPFAHPFYWSPFILFGNWR